MAMAAAPCSHSRLALHSAPHLIQHDGAGKLQVPLERLQQRLTVLPRGDAHPEQLLYLEVAHSAPDVPVAVAEGRVALLVRHTQHHALHLCHPLPWRHRPEVPTVWGKVSTAGVAVAADTGA